MTQLDAETVVRDLYAAFARGDVPEFLRRIDADCDWRCLAPRNVPFGGTWRGPEGVRTFVERVLSSVRLEAFEPGQFLVHGDTVVVLGRDAAVALATGRRYEASWVHVWALRAGLVTAFAEFLDARAVEAAFPPAEA